MLSTTSIVEALDQDIWDNVASRLSLDARIILSTTCKLLRPLDVVGRGDVRVLHPRARVHDEYHRYCKNWRRRCNLYPANDLTFSQSTLEVTGRDARHMTAYAERRTVFLREVCPGLSHLHAAMGRVNWPPRRGWRRMSTAFLDQVTAVKCRHCGTMIRLDLMMMMT